MNDRNKPSIKLQAFFRRHFNNVTFIEGTVLDVSTLKLAKVSLWTGYTTTTIGPFFCYFKFSYHSK